MPTIERENGHDIFNQKRKFDYGWSCTSTNLVFHFAMSKRSIWSRVQWMLSSQALGWTFSLFCISFVRLPTAHPVMRPRGDQKQPFGEWRTGGPDQREKKAPPCPDWKRRDLHTAISARFSDWIVRSGWRNKMAGSSTDPQKLFVWT